MPIGGGSQLEDRRRRLIEQLQRMSDEQFAAVVRREQAARWRAMDLERHSRAHRRDFLDLLGRALTPGELEALSREVLHSWERVFNELEPSGNVSCVFVRSLPEPGSAMLVVTRGGRIRSTFPTRDFAGWQHRHPAAIEVTDRAKGLVR
ncbi:MAG: hypothetical protein HYU88_03360 [Chloroflexi bacterium]|nr:hypothetical protein [Chloroflexota bacterium]MBI4507130.1 hypothetical protein [Chloroflexota bacterium]